MPTTQRSFSFSWTGQYPSNAERRGRPSPMWAAHDGCGASDCRPYGWGCRHARHSAFDSWRCAGGCRPRLPAPAQAFQLAFIGKSFWMVGVLAATASSLRRESELPLLEGSRSSGFREGGVPFGDSTRRCWSRSVFVRSLRQRDRRSAFVGGLRQWGRRSEWGRCQGIRHGSSRWNQILRRHQGRAPPLSAFGVVSGSGATGRPGSARGVSGLGAWPPGVPAGPMVGPLSIFKSGVAVEPGVKGKMGPPLPSLERAGFLGTSSASGSRFSGTGGGVGRGWPPTALEFRCSGRACSGHCRQSVSLNPNVAGFDFALAVGATGRPNRIRLGKSRGLQHQTEQGGGNDSRRYDPEG